MYACTFQSGNFTGCGSEGVNQLQQVCINRSCIIFIIILLCLNCLSIYSWLMGNVTSMKPCVDEFSTIPVSTFPGVILSLGNRLCNSTKYQRTDAKQHQDAYLSLVKCMLPYSGVDLKRCQPNKLL